MFLRRRLIAIISSTVLLFTLYAHDATVPPQSEPARIGAERFLARQARLQDASLATKVQYLIDRAQIADAITAYAYSVDTRNWDLHGAIFQDEFEIRRGDDWRVVSNQERLQSLEAYFQKFTSTQHLGFPLLIEINGDKAYAVASLHARHFNETGVHEGNSLLFGQYEIWFDRMPEGWKISKLAQVNRTRIHNSDSKTEFKSEK